MVLVTSGYFRQKEGMKILYIPASFVSSSAMWKLLLLALPLMGSQLASIGIMTADIIMMGQLSAFDLAAGSLGIRFYQPFYFFALGLTAVISPMIAQAIGAKDRQVARRTFRGGLVIGLIAGVIFTPIVINGAPVLIALGQDEDVSYHARDFLFWTALSLPVFFTYLILRFFMMGNQHTTAQFLTTLGGLLVNIVLNPILAHGYYGSPALGLSGIAIATLISYCLMCISLIVYINWHRDFADLEPFVRLWRIDFQLVLRIIRVGVPNAVIIMSETGMFVVAGLMIGTFGTAALVATGIANQVAAITFMVPLAVSQASAVLVGGAAGRNDHQDLAVYGWSAHLLGFCVAVPMTLIYILFPHQLAGLFIAPDDALYDDAIPLILAMFVFVGIFQLVDGLQAIGTAKLRGLNDTKWPAVIALFSYWVIGIGSAFMLAFYFGFGPASVWAGLGFGLFMASILLTLRWQMQLRQIAGGRPILMV